MIIISDKLLNIAKGEQILTLIDSPLNAGQNMKIWGNITMDNMPVLNIDYSRQLAEQIQNIEIRNPHAETERLLAENNQIGNEQKEYLQQIAYENMKLNAQIDTLNKQIDTQNMELSQLRTANSKLEVVNNTLTESNKHYWRNTFIIGFVVAGIFFVLGLLI